MIGELGTVKRTWCDLPHAPTSSFTSGRMLWCFSRKRYSWESYHWKELKFRVAIWKTVQAPGILGCSSSFVIEANEGNITSTYFVICLNGYRKSHCRRWPWTKWAWTDLVQIKRKITKVNYNCMLMRKKFSKINNILSAWDKKHCNWLLAG